MAKRANIITMIKNEMNKGNIYVLANGNFTNEEAVTKGVKEEYIKALRAEEIGVDVTLKDYTKTKLEGMKTCSELLEYLKPYFPQEAPQEAEEAEEAEPQEAPEVPHETAPKRSKKTEKGSEA